MCCEDCRTEKLKSNILNKILLNEHCISISEYLGCDGCCKMNAILNDPIYKTLDTEQQEIFMYIKMCPFPEWQREVHKYSEWIKAVEEAYDNMYVQFFFTTNYKQFNDSSSPMNTLN